MTPERADRLRAALGRRLGYLRLVVQDVHHVHNMSACLRSAEAFGIQHVHVVRLRERFGTSTVAKGAEAWLSIHHHRSIEDCAKALTAEGFRIAAAVPDRSTATLGSLCLDQPIAVLFGNEHAGLDDAWTPFVKQRFHIPMNGLVQSLNVSVSAAIVLHTLGERVRNEVDPARRGLSQASAARLEATWLSPSVQPLAT